MDEKAIFKFCKEEGCCDACSLRYLGLHHPRFYENVKESVEKYQDAPSEKQDITDATNTTEPGYSTETSNAAGESNNGTTVSDNGTTVSSNGTTVSDNGTRTADSTTDNGANEENGAPDGHTEEPAAKRRRGAVCGSCLGLLQPDTWPDSCRMAKEMLDKKGYDCTTFACALSAPIATLLREKYMQLAIKDKFPEYASDSSTSLKEAWKWSFGTRLASHLGLSLDSGAVSPLLVTLHYEYPADTQELDVLKSISPAAFRPHRRPAVDVTRRGAEQALATAKLEQLRVLQAPAAVARCVGVTAARTPLYIGGRYLKLSRQLPQTPWLVGGRRMMESSVQEIIFQPIADVYKLCPSETEHRLKFVSAGREDVDVRCLGGGRPFALEISDPRRELTAEELAAACEQISRSGSVIVKHMVHVSKDDLTELKKGEESKSKEYEALCIKLAHSALDEVAPDAPVTVTDADIERINTYTNTEPGCDVRVRLVQRTPLRVLHRRPLLARPRAILELEARKLPDHPALFVVRCVTAAGTYVKEWCHGELRRSQPALSAALGAPADILALDVTRVMLPWPKTTRDL